MKIVRSKPVMIAGAAALAKKVSRTRKHRLRRRRLRAFGKGAGFLLGLGLAAYGWSIYRRKSSGQPESPESVIRIPEEHAAPGI